MKSTYPYSRQIPTIYLTHTLCIQRDACPELICDLYNLTVDEYEEKLKRNFFSINDTTHYNDRDFTDDCDYSYLWTPLMVACCNARYWNLSAYAKVLIKYGADVTLKTDKNYDALYYAIEDNADIELIQMLIDAGAEILPLHIKLCVEYRAYKSINSDIIKLIIDKGGIIPNLLYHALYCDIEIIKYLLSKNATIDCKSQEYEFRGTALEMAVRTEKVELLNLILNNKTQFGVNVSDKHILNTAMEYNVSEQIINILLNANFKFDMNNDKTKIYLLTKENNKLKAEIELLKQKN